MRGRLRGSSPHQRGAFAHLGRHCGVNHGPQGGGLERIFGVAGGPLCFASGNDRIPDGGRRGPQLRRREPNLRQHDQQAPS